MVVSHPPTLWMVFFCMITASSITSTQAFSIRKNGLISKSNKSKSCEMKRGRTCKLVDSSAEGKNKISIHKESGARGSGESSFAVRMNMYQHGGERDNTSLASPTASETQSFIEEESECPPSECRDAPTTQEHHENLEDQYQDRRKFMFALLTTTSAFGTWNEFSKSSSANAFERSYPLELNFDDTKGDTSRDLATIRDERIAAKKAQAKKTMDDLSSEPLNLRTTNDVLGSAVWAGALWLLSGSRSNPLVTPLANVLYDGKEEQWLKDRNEGLFSSLPPAFLLVLGLTFLMLGVLTDRAILFLTEGDTSVCLQLAGVSLIGGAALELGRIASGEKSKTRVDFDRDNQLEEEFAEFAEKRLKPGGNCHRSEVVKAFRRYFAKYRQADDPDYPLADIEIERLLRDWNRKMGNEDMSAAGFFTGIQINDQADVFVNR